MNSHESTTGISDDGKDVKGALKKHPKVIPFAKSSTPPLSTGDEDDNRKHLTWDEPTIEEHDQLRGTRMKIDEPNTPYNHYSSDDSHSPASVDQKTPELCWQTLEKKLERVAADRDGNDSSPESKTKVNHDEFVKHRSKHYNEMEMVRKWRQEHSNEEVDENEDENDSR
mmetsp:Transcript_41738/g.50833  ORF Transcript_41738/g.50833 Transcript_41738/m.50833 type:complete len:169 (-) Transcript_41738:60-566(-)|eukprot:CAMPEP_0172497540 /NCGR_PEP_ID=MMETSP1066-20121228/101358_1 /TAXON_ID=671091 /ORGANISM="Coscinodiscus wailesii, Strain CCMP2513" /LENGTH=168 /DNA_ID=CAMNT_0013270377 /DNA_START=30 /DNA_END=536 /DNA_ORIENTATION=+